MAKAMSVSGGLVVDGKAFDFNGSLTEKVAKTDAPAKAEQVKVQDTVQPPTTEYLRNLFADGTISLHTSRLRMTTKDIHNLIKGAQRRSNLKEGVGKANGDSIGQWSDEAWVQLRWLSTQLMKGSLTQSAVPPAQPDKEDNSSSSDSSTTSSDSDTDEKPPEKLANDEVAEEGKDEEDITDHPMYIQLQDEYETLALECDGLKDQRDELEDQLFALTCTLQQLEGENADLRGAAKRPRIS